MEATYIRLSFGEKAEMDQFIQAVKDRPCFYLCVLCFVIAWADLGRWLGVQTHPWLAAGWIGVIGISVGLAVWVWGRPKQAEQSP